MTTFQAIIQGVIFGLAEVLPLSASFHQHALAGLLGWELPPAVMSGVFTGCVAFATLIALRHDFASLISSFLSVVLLRKRPMTLDERMPFFVLLTCLPVGIAWFFGRMHGAETEVNLLGASIVFIVGGVALIWTESRNRRNRKMFDWNWLDALWVGLLQAIHSIPGVGLGWGRSTGALIGGLSRNYHRDAAAKFMLYATLPTWIAHSTLNLREHGAELGTGEMSWLTVGTGALVCVVSAFFAINGLLRLLERKNMNAYGYYRIGMGTLIAAYLIWNQYSGG